MTQIASTLLTCETLDGLPWVDVAGNLRTALLSGRRLGRIAREVLALRRGPGRLTLAEYCYYRLWDSDLPLAEKLRFVGKRVQPGLHVACNDPAWLAATEDKILFHLMMKGAGLPVPDLLAIIDHDRTVPGTEWLGLPDVVREALLDPAYYPFFIKPTNGRYSFGVFSGDRIDTEGYVQLVGRGPADPDRLARELLDYPAPMLLQRRLTPEPGLAKRFGARLCSLRVLVLLTRRGPVISRVVAKLPAPGVIADNFWRPGNMIAAVDVQTGTMIRAVRGTDQAMEVDFRHPETGLPIVGTQIPGWAKVCELAYQAARLFPGVRTQSWDIALTDTGPVALEVNWGGDLNLAQLAYGKGVLDATYNDHLAAVGYMPAKARQRVAALQNVLISNRN